jgi:hypothetical protein
VKKSVLLSILVVVVLVVISTDVSAQGCSMCKLNAENAEHATAGVGRGINNGILYLMGIPYFLLMTIALGFYRKKIVNFIRG